MNIDKLSLWWKDLWGLNVPKAATAQRWEEIRQEYKAKHPTMYRIKKIWARIETYINVLEHYHKIRMWFIYRFIHKTHVLCTGLKPGSHYEFETRVLHGIFETLVYFVEVEYAGLHYFCHSEDRKWYHHRFLRWFRVRNAELGLSYIRWETTLDDPKLPKEEQAPWQAEKARNLIELYNWWKVERVKRPDPYDSSGLTKYFETHTMMEFRDKMDRDEWSAAHEKYKQLVQQYKEEDKCMLLKVIDLLPELWT